MTEITNNSPFKTSVYSRLTFGDCWRLAAPHTWVAAVMPLLCALAFASAEISPLPWGKCAILLVICILMQSAVNTFNDYFDFVKGADSEDDNVEEDDAVLVYRAINPASVLRYAIALLVAAFGFGIYIVIVSGWIPLAIAGVGAVVTVLYSAGKTPISYLPIGEGVSGMVMGALIPLASYQVLTGTFTWWMLLWAVPCAIGVGLIMMTNNCCDIEKDLITGRKTLPIMLGRPKTRVLYHTLMVIWIVAIGVIVGLWFVDSLIIVFFMVAACFGILRALWLNPLVGPSRIGAMAQICSLNVALGSFYAAAVFLGA